MDAVQVRGLKKEYTTYERSEGFWAAVKSVFNRKKVIKQALKGIDFSVAEGEVVGFLGPNGAGKSTAIKVMTGVLYPTEGEVKVLGYVPWKERMRYVKNIGVVFGQKSQLMWDLPPIDSFYLNKSIYSIESKEFEKRLKYLTNLLKVKDVMKQPTRGLSLGERMKCEFIMAMLHKPKIVFLDEPTIGLDVFAKETIREFILRINKKEKVTFIVTTHDLEDIVHVADRVIVINHGVIVFDNSLSRLRKFTGENKYIKVTCEEPIKFKSRKGIDVRNKISPYEWAVVIDTEKCPLNKFIHELNDDNEIIDLDVEEPPIRDIIKEVYNKK